jgi:CAAX amino terminal protease family.
MKQDKININKSRLTIAILIPILELLIGGFVVPYISTLWGKVIFGDILFFIGFAIAVSLYKEVLKADWKKFKVHLIRNIFFALLGVIISYLILSIVRMGLKVTLVAGGENDNLLSISTNMASLGVVGSITSIMAPFTEEIIFRHALFYQWCNRGFVTFLMFLLSSALFGLAHWNNFNGDIFKMIPYMVVGAWFAIIYYKSKNIWQNIMTHFFFDFLQVIAAIVVLILSLI